MEFCPICMLRKGLAVGVESGESSPSEDTIVRQGSRPRNDLRHYELVKGEDGKPVELGRGARGVTYKAVDINLHCSVTLKVISEFSENPLSDPFITGTSLLGPGSFGRSFVLSNPQRFARAGATETCFPSKFYCGHCFGSEALGTCGSPLGNRMHYALRLLLNSSTPWLKSAATETRRVMPLSNSHLI